jgi:abortive infection bacteriophage resistance protein
MASTRFAARLIVSVEAFSFLAKQLLPYRKPLSSTTQQLDDLEAKGLAIEDKSGAASRIESVGYYRFKAYLRPFRDLTQTPKPFFNNSNFDQAWQLYKFDENLRAFVFSIVSKIEVGVRAKLNQAITHATGNPFWYVDSELFGHGNVDYSATVGKVRGIFLNSHEEYALHYKDNYYNEFCKFLSDMPPGWVAIELMSFGNLTSTLRSLDEAAISNLKLDRVSSRELSVNKFRKLCNWLGVIHEVRNHCGHHGRLFNRNLKAPDAIKQILDTSIGLVRITSRDGQKQEDQLNRLYTALAAMQQVLRKLGHDPIGPKLVAMFEEHPIALQMCSSMGFPEDWRNEPLFFR